MKYFISKNTSTQACNRLTKNYDGGFKGTEDLVDDIVADTVPTMRKK